MFINATASDWQLTATNGNKTNFFKPKLSYHSWLSLYKNICRNLKYYTLLNKDDEFALEFMNVEHVSDTDLDYMSIQSNTNSEGHADKQPSDSDSDDLPLSQL